MFFLEIMSVAIGGAIGAVSRFLLSRWMQSQYLFQNFPWGIFACNVIGCLLIGIFYGVLEHKLILGPVWRAAIMIGFLGGFTTFSSFSLDTIQLLQSGEWVMGFSNIFLNLICCLLATVLGLWGVTLFVK